MSERDDYEEAPSDRSGYRWRLFTAGLIGLPTTILVLRILYPSGDEHHAEGGMLPLLFSLFVLAPISLSFLVSAVGIYYDWEYQLFLRLLPLLVVACLVAVAVFSGWAR